MFSIDKSLKRANIARTIRFTESLFELLNRYSYIYDISFNALVLQCCQYALEHCENKTSKKDHLNIK